MEFDNLIECIGNDSKIYRFEYNLEETEELGRKKWLFRIMPEGKAANDWYEFSLTCIDDITGQITLMNNRNLLDYRGKGITEKIIEEAQINLDLTVVSSTNLDHYKNIETESRTPQASKIWERLRKKGRAYYNKELDRYTYLPDETKLNVARGKHAFFRKYPDHVDWFFVVSFYGKSLDESFRKLRHFMLENELGNIPIPENAHRLSWDYFRPKEGKEGPGCYIYHPIRICLDTRSLNDIVLQVYDETFENHFENWESL